MNIAESMCWLDLIMEIMFWTTYVIFASMTLARILFPDTNFASILRTEIKPLFDSLMEQDSWKEFLDRLQNHMFELVYAAFGFYVIFDIHSILEDLPKIIALSTQSLLFFDEVAEAIAGPLYFAVLQAISIIVFYAALIQASKFIYTISNLASRDAAFLKGKAMIILGLTRYISVFLFVGFEHELIKLVGQLQSTELLRFRFLYEVATWGAVLFLAILFWATIFDKVTIARANKTRILKLSTPWYMQMYASLAIWVALLLCALWDGRNYFDSDLIIENVVKLSSIPVVLGALFVIGYISYVAIMDPFKLAKAFCSSGKETA